MTAGRCSRTLRAAVFAVVCVLLAALGHVLMSGSDVPAWALGLGLAVTGAAGWCLAGRERGLPLIVTVVVAAQTALHSAFSFAQSVSGGQVSTGVNGMPGMSPTDMGSMDMGAGTGVDVGTGTGMAPMRMDSMDMSGMDPLGHSMGGSSFCMIGAHLLAALLCGLWLAYGEKAAFRVLRAVAGRLAAPLRLLFTLPRTPDRPSPRVRRRRSDRAPRLLLLVHAIISRGPPVGTAVV
ncbi:hypothetical protein ACWEO4_10490 [Streptomyces sp. NPDC004393]|uniref:hypothetical protein n=1 Tax=Streptomyces sp. NPDC004533 TaxID=3154278 RepID=UPI0033A8FD3B